MRGSTSSGILLRLCPIKRESIREREGDVECVSECSTPSFFSQSHLIRESARSSGRSRGTTTTRRRPYWRHYCLERERERGFTVGHVV